MRIIDGSQGEGGGQILRTSLSLSMCLGIPVKIENIRSGRKKPGLLRQHLTCLRAAQEICGAKVEGDELGSSSVSFNPGEVKSGEYRFAIGSAGSTTLVFQTVFLPLALASGESEVLLEGGTHNGMSPSVDFIQYCFLPEMRKIGIHTEAELKKFGFYPAGGGAWRVCIKPAKEIGTYENKDRGNILAKQAVAMSAKIPSHVTERELSRVQEMCLWGKESLSKSLVRSVGPGNVLSLRLTAENITEVFDVVGERRLSAEKVADRAVSEMNRYLASNAAVGEHLADQLLLPMVLGGGGNFTTIEPSQHLHTNAAVIKQLTNVDISIVEYEDKCWIVSI